MKDEDYEKKVDWLVGHGMTFRNAMILVSYCEIKESSLPCGYVEILGEENIGDNPRT